MIFNINKSPSQQRTCFTLRPSGYKPLYDTDAAWCSQLDFLHGWVKRKFNEILMCSLVAREGRTRSIHQRFV